MRGLWGAAILAVLELLLQQGEGHHEGFLGVGHSRPIRLHLIHGGGDLRVALPELFLGGLGPFLGGPLGCLVVPLAPLSMSL